MLYRNNPPNEKLWNGLGGKIKTKESPNKSAAREIFEESAIRVADAISFQFAGIVTWTNEENDAPATGMYTFIVDFPSDLLLPQKKQNSEGVLNWKPFDWVCDRDNTGVVENIPYFLPDMFDYNIPLHYNFHYKRRQIVSYTKDHLPRNF